MQLKLIPRSVTNHLPLTRLCCLPLVISGLESAAIGLGLFTCDISKKKRNQYLASHMIFVFLWVASHMIFSGRIRILVTKSIAQS